MATSSGSSRYVRREHWELGQTFARLGDALGFFVKQSAHCQVFALRHGRPVTAENGDRCNAASVELDGKPLPKSAWHNPIPVDIGSAQGQGVVRTVNVPMLALASSVPPASTGAARPAAHAGTTSEEADHGAAASSFWTTKREAGAIVGGVGVIGLGIGAVFGIEALSQKSNADDACGTTSGPCLDAQHTTAAKNEIHTAENTARVSTIAFGAWLVAIGAGAYLFFSGAPSSPKAETSSRAVRFVPTAGPSAAGLTVDGRF